VTLSTALSDCLASTSMTESSLVQCVYGTGFPGPITYQQVQDEVESIRQRNACTFPEPTFTVFWNRVEVCLGASDRNYLNTLKKEVAMLIPPASLHPIFRRQP
jgi:hypothetical protein